MLAVDTMGKARAEVLEALRIARSEISSWAGRRAALESESSHACLNSSDASVLGFASRFLSPIVPTLSPTVANFDSLCKDCCELRHPLPLVSRSHAGPSSAQALAETMRSSPALGWQVQRIGEGTIQRTAAKESSEQETCCSRVLSSYAAHDNVRNDATRERVMSAQKRQYEELLGIERDSIRQQEKRQFERTELQSQIVSLQEQLENKQEDEMDEKRNCDGAPQHGPWHLGTLTPDSARLEAESLLAEARQAAEQIKESTKTEVFALEILTWNGFLVKWTLNSSFYHSAVIIAGAVSDEGIPSDHEQMEQVRKAIAMKLAAKAEAKQVKAEAEVCKKKMISVHQFSV